MANSPKRPSSVPVQGTDSPAVEALSASVSKSWRLFLERYEPHRSGLYRFCRHLTASPWDAEDLVQDTLARAFASLASSGEPARSAQAWLFRVAANLWIDETRRRATSAGYASTAERDPGIQPGTARETREAAGTLLVQLGPQERAALVLKDVFDFELEDIASVLSTTPGAVKAALHRGRGKLAEPASDSPRTPVPSALDAFCAAFNARDLDKLTALLLDNATVEVVGATTLHGADKARSTVLWGMLFGSKHMADPADGGEDQRIDASYGLGVLPLSPRFELVFLHGEALLLSWYAHHDGEHVRAVTRAELSEDATRIARLRNYFYTPELIADICQELRLPYRVNGIYLPGGGS